MKGEKMRRLGLLIFLFLFTLGCCSEPPVHGGENLVVYSDPPSTVEYMGGGTSQITVGSKIWGVKGLLYATSFGDDSVTRYAYHNIGTGKLVQGQPYVITAYVKMTDLSAPVVGASQNDVTKDFVFMLGDTEATNVLANVNMGNNIYRVGAYTSSLLYSGVQRCGIMKHGHSSKSFEVSGWQVEDGITPTEYNFSPKTAKGTSISGGVTIR